MEPEGGTGGCPSTAHGPAAPRQPTGAPAMHSVFYIIGVVVVALAILALLGVV